MEAGAAVSSVGAEFGAQRAEFVPVKYGDAGYIRAAGNRGKAAKRRGGKAGRSSGGGEDAGGGGGAELPVARSGERQPRNADVYLCAWPPASHPQAAELTVATRDPADRAHSVHDQRVIGGLLVPAGKLCGNSAMARPRRYPPCQMTSRGVSHDSACDELAERVKRLESWGWGGGGARQYAAMTGEQMVINAQLFAHSRKQRYASDVIRSRHVTNLPSAEQVLAQFAVGEWRPEQ